MTELQKMPGCMAYTRRKIILKIICLPSYCPWGDGSEQGIMVSALEAFCLMIFECFVVVRQKEESPVGR